MSALAATLVAWALAAAPASAEIQSVGAESASNVGKDSATLNGFYSSADGKEAHYLFEWGPTEAYGQKTAAPPGDVAGSASGVQSVPPVDISGLLADTTYHYRLVVSDADGTSGSGDATFTTAPAVTNLSADPASAIRDTSAELNASFDGDGAYETHYFFEWGQSTAYGNATPLPPGTGVAAASGRVSVPPVTISGLQRGSTYHYRVVASNAIGTTASADASFQTADAPSVSNVRSSGVTATTTDLLAEINPHHGQTSYHFEWGATAAYGNSTPVPQGDAGAGNASLPVSVHLDNLEIGVTYHFRVVASSEYGTTVSPDQTFGFYPPNCPNAQVRQETRSNTLPDCRAYELVSPSFAQGAIIFPLNAPATPLATSPSRLAYSAAFGTFSADTGEPANLASDMYVSTRTDTGWTQRFIGRPARDTLMMGGPPGHNEETFLQGNALTSRTFMGAQATPDLSRVVSYDRGWPDGIGQLGHPSNAPYVWDTSTGGLLARWPTNLGQVPNGEDFVGRPEASADLSHFVFQSNIPFAPGGIDVPRTIKCCSGPENENDPLPPASIYDNDVRTGEVRLASLKGDDQTGFAGYVLNVSEDGSRILMSETNPDSVGWLMPPDVHPASTGWPQAQSGFPPPPDSIPGPLYLRANGHTYEIAPGRQIAYVGSTADGASVYLRSKEQLTPDDHDSSSDLYVWHQGSESLTRLSTGDSGDAGDTDACTVTWNDGGCGIWIIDFLMYSGIAFPGSGAVNTPLGFDGGEGGNGYTDSAIASASGDIYFISPEQLVAGKGEAGQANLYVSRKGSVRFVATMAPERVCTALQYSAGCSLGPVARMQVTPSGDHMAFVASSNVTGYDSAGHTEMYTYDAESGRVTCASCRPDGKAPTSDVYASQNGLFQTYDGRVFFSTDDPLVPRDTDGVQDVYEYTEGHPQLISSGIGAAFKGAPGFQGKNTSTGLVSVSANGTDVYFATLDVLVTQDHNGQQIKIYDARTGGGFPAEVTPAKCEAADECHGPGAAPPALPGDRTTASLSGGPKPRPHKAKKHKRKAHKKKAQKKKHAKAKKRTKASRAGKQGGNDRG